MESNIKGLFAAKIEAFRLPRYSELPNTGLYLEQVIKYINGILAPLGCHELTSSMVSNYVKKGVISSPTMKQYSTEQIAYLIFIAIGKAVLSFEQIISLFKIQRATYDCQTAYDYFCSELENMLLHICGIKENIDKIGVTNSQAKTMLRSVIISASHIIFINNCFEQFDKNQ